MKRIFFSIHFILILFFINKAISQDLQVPQANRGTYFFKVSDCIEYALKYNPDILAADSRYKSAGAEITAAFGDFLPSIDLSMGYTRQINTEGGKTVNVGGQIIPLPSTDPNSYRINAGASYVIFNGFSRESNYNRTKDNLSSIYLGNQHLRRSIILNIYRQFTEVLRTKQIIKLRQENLDLAKKDYLKIKAQYDAGVLPVTNIYTQETEISNREMELLKAENDYKISSANLLALMGLNPNVEAEFSDDGYPKSIKDHNIDNFRKEIGSIESATNRAIKNRLDIQSVDYSISSAQLQMQVANSLYFPVLSAMGGWSWTNNNLSKFSELGRSYIGFNLQIPIFDNFKTNYQVQAAKALLDQREIEKNVLIQNINKEIKTAFLNLETAEKQIEISEKALLSAEKSFESAEGRFRVGSISITDYYYANNLLINAKINRITAFYNYFNAQKEVLYSIGNLE